MGVYQQIDSDSKAALRAGDKTRLSVLRMVLSSVKMLVIENGKNALDDSAVIQIIQKQIKQHKESISQFEIGNRPDLVKKESEELKVLEKAQDRSDGKTVNRIVMSLLK